MSHDPRFVDRYPCLYEDTPLTAIREDRDKEVIDAVTATLVRPAGRLSPAAPDA